MPRHAGLDAPGPLHHIMCINGHAVKKAKNSSWGGSSFRESGEIGPEDLTFLFLYSGDIIPIF
jgi:hypothetical protein